MLSSYGYYGAISSLSAAIIIMYAVMALIWACLIGARYVSVAVLFTKAEEAPWKSLIPFYDMYIFFKLTWNTKMFIPYICAAAGYAIGCIATVVVAIQYEYYYTGIEGMIIGVSFMIVCGIALIVFQIILCVKIAKAYGKGGGYAVGLIFLEIIFLMILAFGSAEYREERQKITSDVAAEYHYANELSQGETAQPAEVQTEENEKQQ